LVNLLAIFAESKYNQMNKIALLIVGGIIALSCAVSTVSSNDKVKLGKSYGKYKVDIKNAISVDDMVKTFEAQSGEMEFTIEADLSEVCAKAGCFVKVDKGNGESFMVRFKDHFTIPPATPVGTGAYIHGIAFWDTVSVELQKHFLEDVNASAEEIAAITEPKPALGFTGDGIVLKK
tara:strand:- start:225 stop:755 length:531 start_codon:yes stop_codon:yes gene_type:complete